MSDQGISEEELEKLLSESGIEPDDSEGPNIADAPTMEIPAPSAQPQSDNNAAEGEKTMSQSEIDALLASLASDDD